MIKSEDGKPAAVPSPPVPVRTSPLTDEHTAFEQSLGAMTREELRQSTLRLLQVTLRDYLSGPQFALLPTAMERGVLDPRELRREHTQARVNNEREGFARRILERLTNPPRTLF